MTALALILCAAIAAMGVLVIVSPARVNDLARLFTDKTGMWVASAIRAVLGLGLLAAASESKAPMVLRTLGLIILIVAILIPILGLDRHRKMIDWWLARPRTMQIGWGAVTFVFGILLIYLIL
jgi:cell division protein FtsW (lipid II flippase)